MAGSGSNVTDTLWRCPQRGASIAKWATCCCLRVCFG